MRTTYFVYALLSMLAFASAINASSVSLTVSWDGGHCSVCENTPNNYACSDGHGNWNNGQNYFFDPIPFGNVLTQVVAIGDGEWGCSGSSSNMELQLQGNHVDFETGYGQCSCSSCDPLVTFNGYVYANNNSFPSYNYGGVNMLQLLAHTGVVCVQDLTLTLFYEPGAPGNDTRDFFFPNATCEDFGGCGLNGTCNENGTACECDTHFGGPNCQCNVPSYHLVTDHPPTMDVDRSGFSAQDMLRLYVNDSAKYYDTNITFTSSLGDDCNYPNSNQQIFWATLFNNETCEYTYIGDIPWVTAWPTCIFDREETTNWITFTGEMNLHHTEKLEDIRDYTLTRTIVNKMPFQVQYPKTVDLHVEQTRVFCFVNVMAAIVHRSFLPLEPFPFGHGSMRLYTSVQWPYRLDGPLVAAALDPSFGLTVVGPVSEDCPDDGNSTCHQWWDFEITPGLDDCELDGDYMFNYTVYCQPSQSGDCPLTGGSVPGSVLMTLDSSYYCPQVIETIDLGGQVSVYGDEALTVPKYSFQKDQWVYVLVETNSELATIVDTRCGVIELALPDNSMVVLYNGSNTPAGDSVSLFVDDDHTGNDNECWFTFETDDGFFGFVDPDDFESISLWVVAEVTYLNTDPLNVDNTHVVLMDIGSSTYDKFANGHTHDELFSVDTVENDQDLRVNTMFAVRDTESGSSTSSGSSSGTDLSNGAIAGIAVACVIVLGGAGLWFYRRNKN